MAGEYFPKGIIVVKSLENGVVKFEVVSGQLDDFPHHGISRINQTAEEVRALADRDELAAKLQSR